MDVVASSTTRAHHRGGSATGYDSGDLRLLNRPLESPSPLPSSTGGSVSYCDPNTPMLLHGPVSSACSELLNEAKRLRDIPSAHSQVRLRKLLEHTWNQNNGDKDNICAALGLDAENWHDGCTKAEFTVKHGCEIFSSMDDNEDDSWMDAIASLPSAISSFARCGGPLS